jgi:hypothetical protein
MSWATKSSLKHRVKRPHVRHRLKVLLFSTVAKASVKAWSVVHTHAAKRTQANALTAVNRWIDVSDLTYLLRQVSIPWGMLCIR